MKTVETVKIWVCSCCFMAAVNGEPCQCCADHEEDGPCNGCEQHPDGLMGSISSEDNTTPGMFYSEHTNPEACEADPERSCDCETDNFSTSQCEGCGTYLHGERRAMTLWIGENKV